MRKAKISINTFFELEGKQPDDMEELEPPTIEEYTKAFEVLAAALNALNDAGEMVELLKARFLYCQDNTAMLELRAILIEPGSEQKFEVAVKGGVLDTRAHLFHIFLNVIQHKFFDRATIIKGRADKILLACQSMNAKSPFA